MRSVREGGMAGMTNKQPVIWQGQELPQARPGNVWLLHIYPGGRMEVVQRKPNYATTVDLAVKDLMAGGSAHVWLGDAETTVALWQQAKAAL